MTDLAMRRAVFIVLAAAAIATVLTITSASANAQDTPAQVEPVGQVVVVELSATPSPSAPGEVVTVTATVAAGGVPVTSGEVYIRYDERGFIFRIRGGPVDANGQVTFTGVRLAPQVGSWPITAWYYSCATCGTIVASTMYWHPVLTGGAGDQTTVELTSSPRPSSPGQDVTFTATIISRGRRVTGGTVDFRSVDGTVADDVPVDADGQATVTIPFATAGDHFVEAVYRSGTGQLTLAGITHVVNGPTTTTSTTTAPITTAPTTTSPTTTTPAAPGDPSQCGGVTTASSVETAAADIAPPSSSEQPVESIVDSTSVDTTVDDSTSVDTTIGVPPPSSEIHTTETTETVTVDGGGQLWPSTTETTSNVPDVTDSQVEDSVDESSPSTETAPASSDVAQTTEGALGWHLPAGEPRPSRALLAAPCALDPPVSSTPTTTTNSTTAVVTIASVPPTTTSAADPTVGAPPPAVGAAGGGAEQGGPASAGRVPSGALPATGSPSTMPLVAGAIALVIAGGGLISLATRRRRS